VTLTAAGGTMLGDFNDDGLIDGADFTNWKTNFGMSGSVAHAHGDADADADVDGGDFLVWQRLLGSLPALASATGVPEPMTAVLLLLGSTTFTILRRRH
jgi:hypothetical protein